MAAIVLIAINPNKQIAQARDTVRQADINTIQKVLEQYLIDNKAYPISISTTPGYICNTASLQTGGPACTGFVDLKVLVPNYIAEIPRDPQATGTNTGYIVSINPSNNKIYVQASLAERRIVIINSLNIVTSGLVLNLDAGNTASYPGTGTTWTDLSGNGNNGTLVNGVGYNFANGGSLTFNGTNQNINVGDNNIFKIPSQLTLEATFRISSYVGWSGIIGKSNSAKGVYAMQLANSVNKIRFSYNIFAPWTNFVDGNYTLITNQWTHSVITYDGLNVRMYINSVLDRTVNIGNINFDTASGYPVSIGQDPPGTNELFNGNISSTRIYNRVLSDVEVQQNFNAIRARYRL